MTKVEANRKGLVFTGSYEWNKDTLKEKMITYKEKYPGCKFYIVDAKPGYSIYGDIRYNVLKTVNELHKELEVYIPNNIAAIEKEYAEKIAEQKDRQNKYSNMIREYEEKLKTL
jgi:hypothetical protein